MRQLSDGQRGRVVFAYMATQAPHLLLLDEPTNHLDFETIEALADALVEFEGGVVLVSNDFRLISQVAKEIWICEKETVTKWEGDILKYKKDLQKKISAQYKKHEKAIRQKQNEGKMVRSEMSGTNVKYYGNV
jgi:ATP-binding cassette, subfamily F, member 2